MPFNIYKEKKKKSTVSNHVMQNLMLKTEIFPIDFNYATAIALVWDYE